MHEQELRRKIKPRRSRGHGEEKWGKVGVTSVRVDRKGENHRRRRDPREVRVRSLYKDRMIE